MRIPLIASLLTALPLLLQSEDSPSQLNLVGWTVHLGEDLRHAPMEQRGPALRALEAHLLQVSLLVPPKQLEQLRAAELQIDLDHPLRTMQYHPSRRWLEANGHSTSLAKRVHVPRAASLTDGHLHWIQPRVILHELAHAYHDQVLGFDEERIRAAYESALESGSYDEVLHVNGQRRRHYALTSPQEYFAEGTEAWFGCNDFYPFVRAELAEHDPTLHELLQQIWGRQGD